MDDQRRFAIAGGLDDPAISRCVRQRGNFPGGETLQICILLRVQKKNMQDDCAKAFASFTYLETTVTSPTKAAREAARKEVWRNVKRKHFAAPHMLFTTKKGNKQESARCD